MILTNLEQLLDIVRSQVRRHRLAVVMAAEGHVLEAVARAKREGLADPLLFGNREEIPRLLEELGESVDGWEIRDVREPLEAAVQAVAAVKAGDADVLMKGSLQTGEFLSAVIDKEKGLLENGRILSLLSINEIPGYHKLLLATDAGIVRSPNLEQKAGIVRNAVEVLASYGYERPKVAALCAVETVNPKMPETEDAAALAKMGSAGELGNCVVEGPISMDIALDAERARIKEFQSEVSGDPDILLWPNVLTGNITMKALGRFTGLKGLSFAVGARVPLVVTSRGTSVDAKYRAILGALSICRE